MIELTDEMIRVAEIAYGGNVQGDIGGAIKAVLAIVEREQRARDQQEAVVTGSNPLGGDV